MFEAVGCILIVYLQQLKKDCFRVIWWGECVLVELDVRLCEGPPLGLVHPAPEGELEEVEVLGPQHQLRQPRQLEEEDVPVT